MVTKAKKEETPVVEKPVETVEKPAVETIFQEPKPQAEPVAGTGKMERRMNNIDKGIEEVKNGIRNLAGEFLGLGEGPTLKEAQDKETPANPGTGDSTSFDFSNWLFG